NDMSAALQRRLHRSLGGSVTATDQFHDDIDVRLRRELHWIVEPAIAADVDAAVARAIARRDGDELHLLVHTPGWIGKQAEKAAAHGAQSSDANPQLAHDLLRRLSRVGLQKLFQMARGLANALLVLNQRDAHKAVAVLAKASSRRNRDLGAFHQPL